MKARCLYEPARVFFGLWGRLVPRVPFSSDEQWMPWEFMGVYSFFRLYAPDFVFNRPLEQDMARHIRQ